MIQLFKKGFAIKHSNLPHISLKGYYQFVTFRTYDSIDSFILKLSAIILPDKIKQYKIDRYLDFSHNGRYLNDNILLYLRDYLLSCDGKLFELIAFSIMPNHIHLLFRETIPLTKVMQTFKGTTAFEINKMLKKSGKFWANGYFDRLIRDQKHFEITYNYIKNNAPKAGLKDCKDRFYGIYN